MGEAEDVRPTRLTVSMVLIGTAIGSLVCSANVYFGLQIGSVSTMSASTALLSFAIFKTANKWIANTFTATENVVVQAIASSVAGTPITASLWSLIPAYEYVRHEDEGGIRRFTLLELILWSLGVAFFGTIFSAPFRSYFLIEQRLRFPSGYASGVLIGVLHNDDDVAQRAKADKTTKDIEPRGEDLPVTQERSDPELSSNLRIVALCFSLSVGFVITAYFVPVLSQVPILGTYLEHEWLWCITLSPAIASFGMIIDAHVAISMLEGAIIGWGILSPIVKMKGWANGPVGSMEGGVRGWLMWISIALLLGDTTSRILYRTTIILYRMVHDSIPSNAPATRLQSPPDSETQPLLGQDTRDENGRGHAESNAISKRMALVLLAFSTCLCVACTYSVFSRDIPVYLILLSVVVALPLCLVVIQSSGETDTVPSNQLSNACQLLFGLMISRTAQTKLSSMILAGVTEGGLWQSAVLMSDLKAAYLVRASPKVMFYAQLLGSGLGAVVGSAIYRLFTALYDIPSRLFQIPFAYMWANTARLVASGALPTGVSTCFWVFFGLAVCLQWARTGSVTSSWRAWIPSPVAMAIGMSVTPQVSLARFAGAMLRLYLLRRQKVSELAIICAATGCVLGEGTFGFLPAILALAGVPQLKLFESL